MGNYKMMNKRAYVKHYFRKMKSSFNMPYVSWQEPVVSLRNNITVELQNIDIYYHEIDTSKKDHWRTKPALTSEHETCISGLPTFLKPTHAAVTIT